MTHHLNENRLSLPPMELGLYTFSLQMEDAVELPLDKGPLLRGGFGINLKHTVCVFPGLPPCAECILKESCAYPFLFEPSPTQNAEVLRNHSAIPFPFVFKPPLDGQRKYTAGDLLEFQLLLVGRAIEYLPYFLITFQRLGQRGLGKERGRYTLHKVSSQNFARKQDLTIFEDGVINELRGTPSHTADIEKYCEEYGQSDFDGQRLSLQFRTRTRIKHEGKFLREPPPFHVVVRTLLRRISSLSYFYCDERWQTDYKHWITLAQQVEIASADLKWQHKTRYSTRKQQHTNLSGIMGNITYQGDLAAFIPLLRLGELIHIGKGTVFGNGRFKVNH